MSLAYRIDRRSFLAPMAPDRGLTGLRRTAASQLAKSASPLRPGSTLGLSLFVSASIQGLTLFTGVVLARELGPHARGELAAVLLWPSILASLGSLGLAESATFHSARSVFRPDELLGTLLSIALVQAAVLASVGLIVIPRILGHYGTQTVHLGEAYLAFVPLNLVTLSLMGILNGRQHFRAFHALRIFVFVALACGLGGLALFDRLTVGTATTIYVVANLVAAGAASWFVLRLDVTTGRFSMDAARALVGFGIRSHASNVSSTLNQRLDQLLISAFLAPVKLGLYVVATTLTSAVSLIGWSIAMVVLPTIARTEGNQRKALAGRFIGLTVALSTAATLPLVVLAPTVLGLFFGASFRSVADVARVLLIASVFLSVNRALEAALQGIARPLDAGIAEFIALGATVAGLAILLPALGLLGAAVASLVAYLISTAWMSRRLARVLGSSLSELLIPRLRECRALLAREGWQVR
jgi:O-antigen/teichoic acid export membrane protein